MIDNNNIINDYPDYGYNYRSFTLDSGNKSGCSGACFNWITVKCTSDNVDVLEKVNKK